MIHICKSYYAYVYIYIHIPYSIYDPYVCIYIYIYIYIMPDILCPWCHHRHADWRLVVACHHGGCGAASHADAVRRAADLHHQLTRLGPGGSKPGQLEMGDFTKTIGEP